MKKRSRVITLILSLIMAISCIGAGVMFAAAAEEETAPITIVSYPSEFAGGINDTDLRLSQTGLGGENVTNLEKATIDGKPFKEYVLFNGEVIDTNKINVHYCAKNTFSISINDQSIKTVGATLELLKGLPIPNADKTTSAGVLGESFKLVYTVNGWIKTAATDSQERTDVKVTGLGTGFGNGESIVFDLGRQGSNMNYTNVQDLSDCGKKVASFILYNGNPVNGEFSVHLYENAFYIYPNTGFGFEEGDMIEILAGLHFPASQDGSAFKDYLGTGIKVKFSNGSWAESADAGSVNSLNKLGGLTYIEAGATMPAMYEFSAEFKLEASETELSDLQEQANYSENFFINGKSVKQINEEVKAEDADGIEIPAVTISAVGTTIKVTAVADTGVLDPETNITFKISKAFVFETKHVLTEDIVRYYIPELSFWSDVAPYEIEKTNVVHISSVSFDVIDNGVNGSVDITFDGDIAEGMMLLYSGHPEYLLSNSVPAGAGYAKEQAAALASSGATRNILENIYINGKKVGDYWAELSGAEAKSSRFQMHILSKNVLSIRSNVTNGFGDTDNIEITFKAGFTFFSGAYIDQDVTLRYDGTQQKFVPVSLAISAEKTQLNAGESTALTLTVDPSFISATPVFTSSDETVAKVEAVTDEETAAVTYVVKALTSGTAKIKVSLDGVVSNEIEITVSAPATGVTLDKTTAEMKVGDELTLTATVQPEGSTDAVVWTSSDDSVATVENGKVVAKKAGTVTITAKAGEQSAVCTITVSEKSGGNDNTGDTDKDNTQTEEPETSGGCNSSAGISLLAAGTLLCVGAAIVIFRKRA